MTQTNNTQDLINSWKNSPFPSTKLTTYFQAYTDLFVHLRFKKCVFVETGVLGGGSLFMWRDWLGPEARIIGIDLNPQALKWKDYGFEIYIGDQGDPNFWRDTYKQIGVFDAMLDDGGHQSFQQVVTLVEAIKHAGPQSIVAIEDTHTSFMKDFAAHGTHTFLNYAKTCTDILTARGHSMYPNRMAQPINNEILGLFKHVYSIQFYTSIVGFKINTDLNTTPKSQWNHNNAPMPQDYRSKGNSSAEIIWPDPYGVNKINIQGTKDN
jgi:hypothetical protein